MAIIGSVDTADTYKCSMTLNYVCNIAQTELSESMSIPHDIHLNPTEAGREVSLAELNMY